MSARSLAEKLVRNISFRRRLPPEVGGAQIFVSTAGGLKYLAKPMRAVDPSLLRNVRELVRPGDTIWDVGVNVGLFAFAAAGIAGPTGQVIAFEPDAWLVQLLRRSAALQSRSSGGSAPVRIIPAGVGSAVALREFHISARARAANSLAGYGSSQAGDVMEKQTVPIFNLDWLLDSLPPPRVLKVDVEGAELEVFNGQTRMLQQVRPAIISEVASQNTTSIGKLLTDHGYRIFDGEQPLSNGTTRATAVWNTIAIPQERVQDFVN